MRVPAVACLALAVLASAARAQPVDAFAETIADADELYFAGLPAESYELLTAHLEAHPADYDALWRAARAAVVLGIVEVGITRQNVWLDPAIELGDRAVAERPDGLDGRYWRGAAEGRRALNAGNNYASELAQRVYDDAHAILAVDSLHGGAHNLLGRVNYEIMDLSRIERFIARLLVSNRALRESSWDAAELHLRRATELWPDHVLFQLDLAQFYRKRGREAEARAALERVTHMPAVHPPDKVFKEDAQRFLEELGS